MATRQQWPHGDLEAPVAFAGLHDMKVHLIACASPHAAESLKVIADASITLALRQCFRFHPTERAGWGFNKD